MEELHRAERRAAAPTTTLLREHTAASRQPLGRHTRGRGWRRAALSALNAFLRSRMALFKRSRLCCAIASHSALRTGLKHFLYFGAVEQRNIVNQREMAPKRAR